MPEIRNINDGWLFHMGDCENADYMGYQDGAWQRVRLPHDWSVGYPFDPRNASGTGYLPGGTGWYRKHFVLEDLAGKRVCVRFGGAMRHARVYCNSYYLGCNAYGYTTFSFDLTPFVREGENVLAVRLEHEDIADSRWFTGSGLYRDVDLEISGEERFAEYGVFAFTRSADAENAEVTVRYETVGGEQTEFSLLDENGKKAASAAAPAGSGEIILHVEKPCLWSTEEPYLYTLRACVRAGGAETDIREIPFGIRTFRFDADKGFFLNGEPMKLKGVCVHHDAGALGAAVPKDVWRRRLKKFREAGCNALRTAHNPPDAHLLDLCDELGFLCMDEAFDEWEGPKNKWWQGHNVYPPKHYGYAEDYPQWHVFDLETMVKRDRNHPCVILWSIGNEIDYPNDPYGTPLFDEVLGNNDANKPKAERVYDPKKPDAGRLAVIAKELTGIVHALDTTRPVTSALSFPELSNRTGFADVLDLSGYNYKEQFYEEDHAQYPERVILGSENSHSPEAWKAVRDHDYISGQFLWTGVDFLGECRGWPLRISQAGMLDLCGFEKPSYWLRRALWTDEPFVKLAVGGERGIWDGSYLWNGEPGEEKTVFCFTNLPSVTLYRDGKEYARAEVQDAEGYVRFELPYSECVLEAEAGGESDLLAPAGRAVCLRLKQDTVCLPTDGSRIAQIEAELLDANGNTAYDDTEVTWQLLGDGEILGIENGKPDDLTPYSSHTRSTYRGRAIVYVCGGTIPGTLRLHAFTRTGLRADCSFMIG